MCPECMSVVPMVLATGGGVASAAPPKPAAPSAPSVSRPSIPPKPAAPAPPAADSSPDQTFVLPESMDEISFDIPEIDVSQYNPPAVAPPKPQTPSQPPRPQARPGSAPSMPPRPPAHKPAGVESSFSLEHMYDSNAPAPPAADQSFHDQQTMITPPPGAGADEPLDRTVVTPPPGIPPSKPSVRQAPAPPPRRNEQMTDVHSRPPVDSAVPRTVTEADEKPAVSGGATPGTEEMKALIGRNVDGFVIEKLLGAGGMGAVFLAHQVSLDRKVALKVLPKKFSDNPELIARFTREALAAAQLNHHNIIQVFDVGSTGDLHYIAMEFVNGRNLGDMIRKEGRLQIDDAAAFVLQAARGLKYAHDRGIVHRDIKPDNLMVNEHGIVKVADMGLAKWRKDARDDEKTRIRDVMSEAENRSILERAGSDMTMANIAMGTPAYMAPEQARDAANVGPAADQYSLGCTLYYLCAGTAPYSGTTAFDLISKHMNEPLTPLDVHIKAVPTALNGIVKKMLEKEPALRYSNLGAVVKDIEAYLGIESEKGPYTPREHHLAVLEECIKTYNSAKKTKFRKLVRLAFFALMPLLFIAALLGGSFPMAGGVIGLMLLTPLFAFKLNGILTKDYLFRRVRSVILGMSIKSWLATAGCTILVFLLLFILQWWMWWLVFAVIAAGLAAAWQFGIIKPLRAERQAPIEKTQQMLKELRVRGVGEEALMDFVCRFAPADWEEFFEEIFGYENMILARGKWAAADKVKPRKKFALWRDPLARWLEQIEEQRKEEREKKSLKKAEVNRLKARGVSSKEAEQAAELEATRVMTEGLIKHIPEDKPKVRRRVSLGPVFKLAGWALRGVCLAVGGFVTAMAGASAITSMGIFDAGFVASYAPSGYFEWGAGNSFVGLGAGILCLLMAFASRGFLRFLALLGTVLLICTDPILNLAQQSLSYDDITQWTGIGLVLAGFGMSALSKFSGGKF